MRFLFVRQWAIHENHRNGSSIHNLIFLFARLSGEYSRRDFLVSRLGIKFLKDILHYAIVAESLSPRCPSRSTSIQLQFDITRFTISIEFPDGNSATNPAIYQCTSFHAPALLVIKAPYIKILYNSPAVVASMKKPLDWHVAARFNCMEFPSKIVFAFFCTDLHLFGMQSIALQFP